MGTSYLLVTLLTQILLNYGGSLRKMSESKIIEYLLKFRPTPEWITSQSGLPFLKMNVYIPTDTILQEWHNVKEKSVPHRPADRYGPLQNTGWKSLTVYGKDTTDTVTMTGNLTWTSIAEQLPNTVSWLKDTFVIDENTGRIRFMLLEPGGVIVPHTDRDSKKLSEFNIALTNPDGCVFRFKNQGNVPFKPGSMFMMDISNEHFVTNMSDVPRVHMIVHSKLRDTSIISKSYENCYYR